MRNGAVLGCGATTGEYYFGDFPRSLPPLCATVDDRWATGAKAPTDAILVFLGGWEVFDPKVDGHRLSVTSDAWHDWFVRELRRRIETMQAAAPRPVPIGLVELACPTTDTMRIGLGAWSAGSRRGSTRSTVPCRDVAREMGPQVRTVSYADVVCDANGDFVTVDRYGDHPRPDGLHAQGPAACGSGSPSSTSSHPT